MSRKSLPSSGERQKRGKKSPEIAAVHQRIQLLETELKSLKEKLREERTRREQAEAILRKREPVLTERVKEMSCLYSVVNLLEDSGYASEAERIKDLVKIIPTGWYYPNDAWAQIILGGKEYRTGNFQDTSWKQSANIPVEGKVQGTLTVGYLEEKPPREEGPFWLEERMLIDVLARLIGEIAGPRLSKESGEKQDER